MIGLNQLKKEYNNSLSEIPEERLKELFYQLWHQAYHALFIDRDKTMENKALNAIDALQNSNDSWKVFKTSYDAIVNVPIEILGELHNRKNGEIKDIRTRLLSAWLVLLSNDLEFNDAMIECIDNCRPGNERKCLESIKKDLIKVRDKEMAILKKDYKLGYHHEIINHLESKKELSGSEIEIFKIIREFEANGELAENEK